MCSGQVSALDHTNAKLQSAEVSDCCKEQYATDYEVAPFQRSRSVQLPILSRRPSFTRLAIGFVRRQYSAIGAAVVVMLFLAVVYVAISSPRFTGQAVLLIDTHKMASFLQQQSPLGDLPIDSDTVDTQIEILNSENIALSVIRDLHLAEDPEFNSPPVNPFRMRMLNFRVRLTRLFTAHRVPMGSRPRPMFAWSAMRSTRSKGT